MPYDVEVFYRNKQTFLAPPELAKIHPLGKSPVVSVTPAGSDAEPIVLAESGFMTQYLCEHLPEGQRLTPKRWRDGQEGKLGGETEGWMRYQYLLHYCEGSFMPILVMALIIGKLQGPDVPFIVRPITSIVASRIFSMFIFPNARKHLALLDQQLATSPDGGKYLCGPELTAADILISFPLVAAKARFDDMGSWNGGSWRAEFPRVGKYLDLLEAQEGYKKSLAKIEEIERQG